MKRDHKMLFAGAFLPAFVATISLMLLQA